MGEPESKKPSVMEGPTLSLPTLPPPSWMGLSCADAHKLLSLHNRQLEKTREICTATSSLVSYEVGQP